MVGRSQQLRVQANAIGHLCKARRKADSPPRAMSGQIGNHRDCRFAVDPDKGRVHRARQGRNAGIGSISANLYRCRVYGPDLPRKRRVRQLSDNGTAPGPTPNHGDSFWTK